MQPQQPRKALSGWTNLQDIFAANKGNGAQMNDKVYGGLESAGQTALDRLSGASAGFQGAVNSAGVGRSGWEGAGDSPFVDTTATIAGDPTRQQVRGGTVGTSGGDTDKTGGPGVIRDSPQETARKAQQAARDAGSAARGATQATANATAGAQQTYKGPRTLKEYDPGVGSAIGDAAARIGASPQSQFSAAYGGANAGGGALDQAIMGNEGGAQRSDALQGKFGKLMEQLRTSQADAAKYATGVADPMNARAAGFGTQLPGLQQAEKDALAAKDAADAAFATANGPLSNRVRAYSTGTGGGGPTTPTSSKKLYNPSAPVQPRKRPLTDPSEGFKWDQP